MRAGLSGVSRGRKAHAFIATRAPPEAAPGKAKIFPLEIEARSCPAPRVEIAPDDDEADGNSLL